MELFFQPSRKRCPLRPPPGQLDRQSKFSALFLRGLCAGSALIANVLLAAPHSLPTALAEPSPSNASSRDSSFRWTQIEEGYALGRYIVGSKDSFLPSEVVLAKFSPTKFSFHAVRAVDGETPSTTDLRSLTRQSDGVAGINAHFFDENDRPLGLLIENGEQQQKLHRSGRVLTGIFAIKKGIPTISLRERFLSDGASMAVQAGPRLIEDGKRVAMGDDEGTSRRSGVALTKSNEVILYATVLRFPGASFDDIQAMLLDPALGVWQAMNLDGGGSSQLFIAKQRNVENEIFITGGDAVPVGLIVKRR